MIVFHTSNTVVSAPDVLHSRPYLDFGQGFYFTPTKMQAVNYAQRFFYRNWLLMPALLICEPTN